jgi:hypothetical protein
MRPDFWLDTSPNRNGFRLLTGGAEWQKQSTRKRLTDELREDA